MTCILLNTLIVTSERRASWEDTPDDGLSRLGCPVRMCAVWGDGLNYVR